MLGSREQHRQKTSDLEGRLWQERVIDPKAVEGSSKEFMRFRNNQVENFFKEQFSETQYNLLNDLDRKIAAGSLTRALPIDGLREGTYAFKFEHIPVHNIPDFFSGEDVKPRTATYIVDVEKDLDHSRAKTPVMNLVLTVPVSDAEKTYMTGLAKKIHSGSTLSQRVAQAASKSNPEQFMRQYLDPEEHRSIEELSTVHSILVTDASLATQYFMHMASLNYTGDFAEIKNMKSLHQLKGVHGTQAQSIHYSSTSEIEPFERGTLRTVSDSEHKAFKEFLAKDPWYKNDLVTNLDWNKMIRDFGQLGNARLNSQELRASAHQASQALKSITQEIYEQLGGQDEDGSFMPKLEYLSDRLGFREELELHKHAYFTDQEDVIVAPSARDGREHKGKLDFGHLNGLLDEWATQFYTDVTKTVLSSLCGKPQGFFEYDDFARKTQLYKTQGPRAALIPASKKLAYKNRTDK